MSAVSTLCSHVDDRTHERCIRPATPHDQHIMAWRELGTVVSLERRARKAKLLRTYARTADNRVVEV